MLPVFRDWKGLIVLVFLQSSRDTTLITCISLTQQSLKKDWQSADCTILIVNLCTRFLDSHLVALWPHWNEPLKASFLFIHLLLKTNFILKEHKMLRSETLTERRILRFSWGLSELLSHILQYETTAKQDWIVRTLVDPVGVGLLVLRCLSQFMDQRWSSIQINRAKRNFVDNSACTLNRWIFFYLYLPFNWRYF